MKILKIIKFSIYLLAGILILIFNNFFLQHIGYTICFVMLLDAVFDIIEWVNKGIAKEGTKFFEAIVLIILAIAMILVRNELSTCLIILAVWMILSEGQELTNCIQRLMKRRPAFINIIESLFIITMSMILIANPNEHHAHIHIFILGIEMICEVLFYLIDYRIDKYLDEKENK